MNNRTINNFIKLAEKISNKVADILLPKEKLVQTLEAFGPDGLFEKIPRAENFDLTKAGGLRIKEIKAIFNYKTTLCRQAIWEIKYRANQKLIRDFSLLLYEFILDELTELNTFSNYNKPILIPIPSSPTRTKEKGFNQCILITRELMRLDKERNGNNFTCLENFLVKEKDTEHQARVSNRKSRLNNLVNTFSINESVRPTEISRYSFIIIDDVITTGATMNEAFRTLKSVGIKKIRGFALAH
jgi:competence protein ComFC